MEGEGEPSMVRLRVLSPLVRLAGEEMMEVPGTTTVTHLKTIILTRLEGQPTVKVGFSDSDAAVLNSVMFRM